MDLKYVEVSYVKYDHGTDYDTEHLTYKNVDTYFFKNKGTGETYRWSMNGNGKYGFYENAVYRISANVGTKNQYGTKITHTKVQERITNTYGSEIWRDVRPL